MNKKRPVNNRKDPKDVAILREPPNKRTKIQIMPMKKKNMRKRANKKDHPKTKKVERIKLMKKVMTKAKTRSQDGRRRRNRPYQDSNLHLMT